MFLFKTPSRYSEKPLDFLSDVPVTLSLCVARNPSRVYIVSHVLQTLLYLPGFFFLHIQDRCLALDGGVCLKSLATRDIGNYTLHPCMDMCECESEEEWALGYRIQTGSMECAGGKGARGRDLMADSLCVGEP